MEVNRTQLRSSRGRSPRSRFARSGMTLMEIMVVIALVAALTTVTAYGLGFIGAADVKGESLRFSGVVRYVYNESATQKRTLQLVIEMDSGKFYVDELDVAGALSPEELAGTNLHVSMDEDEENRFALDRAKRIDEEDEEFAGINRSRQSGPLLSPDDAQLEPGVHFVGIMTSHHEKIQWDGVATINFFPSGFVERTVLYIGNDRARETQGEEGTVYSLLINQLTGQSTIRPGKVDVDDRFFSPEEDD